MRNKQKLKQDETSFLSKLVLWSSDPGIVEEVLPYARAGNRSAQYAMGLIYAEGRGVEQDNLQAYLWLNHASRSGDDDAGVLLSVVMQKMSLEEIKAADRLLDANGGLCP